MGILVTMLVCQKYTRLILAPQRSRCLSGRADRAYRSSQGKHLRLENHISQKPHFRQNPPEMEHPVTG